MCPALSGHIKLLYVAPERLISRNFLSQLDRMEKNTGLSLIAVDEAHLTRSDLYVPLCRARHNGTYELPAKVAANVDRRIRARDSLAVKLLDRLFEDVLAEPVLRA